MEITRTDEAIVAQLVGRLDTAASIQFQKDMQPLLDNAGEHIILDMKELSFISSSGLRLLLSLLKASQAKQGKMTLRNVSNDVMQVLSLTGFDKLFSIEK